MGTPNRKIRDQLGQKILDLIERRNSNQGRFDELSRFLRTLSAQEAAAVLQRVDKGGDLHEDLKTWFHHDEIKKLKAQLTRIKRGDYLGLKIDDIISQRIKDKQRFEELSRFIQHLFSKDAAVLLPRMKRGGDLYKDLQVWFLPEEIEKLNAKLLVNAQPPASKPTPLIGTALPVNVQPSAFDLASGRGIASRLQSTASKPTQVIVTTDPYYASLTRDCERGLIFNCEELKKLYEEYYVYGLVSKDFSTLNEKLKLKRQYFLENKYFVAYEPFPGYPSDIGTQLQYQSFVNDMQRKLGKKADKLIIAVRGFAYGQLARNKESNNELVEKNVITYLQGFYQGSQANFGLYKSPLPGFTQLRSLERPETVPLMIFPPVVIDSQHDALKHPEIKEKEQRVKREKEIEEFLKHHRYSINNTSSWQLPSGFSVGFEHEIKPNRRHIISTQYGRIIGGIQGKIEFRVQKGDDAKLKFKFGLEQVEKQLLDVILGSAFSFKSDKDEVQFGFENQVEFSISFPPHSFALISLEIPIKTITLNLHNIIPGLGVKGIADLSIELWIEYIPDWAKLLSLFRGNLGIAFAKKLILNVGKQVKFISRIPGKLTQYTGRKALAFFSKRGHYFSILRIPNLYKKFTTVLLSSIRGINLKNLPKIFGPLLIEAGLTVISRYLGGKYAQRRIEQQWNFLRPSFKRGYAEMLARLTEPAFPNNLSSVINLTITQFNPLPPDSLSFIVNNDDKSFRRNKNLWENNLIDNNKVAIEEKRLIYEVDWTQLLVDAFNAYVIADLQYSDSPLTTRSTKYINF